MSLGAINSLGYAVAHPERLSQLVIIDAGPEMRRPGSSRIRDFVNGVADTVTIEGIIEKAMEFNPRRDPKILRRSLMHALLRQEPDGTWKWKYDRRRFQVLDQEAHRAERAAPRRRPRPRHLPDPDRPRRRKRRLQRRRRHPPSPAPSRRGEFVTGAQGRPHGPRRQPKRSVKVELPPLPAAGSSKDRGRPARICGEREFRPIHSEADYDAALAEVEECFRNEPKRGTPEGDRFEILLALIGAYEKEHWRIEAPTDRPLTTASEDPKGG